MVSIVIPLYNKEHSIATTLQTVLTQTWQDLEIIIVDDGSTDNSLSIVRCFADERIHIFQQANAGVSAARNRGIKEAHGELIAFLDADDEWKPDYLATQMELVEKYPQCDVFATRYETCPDEGVAIPAIIRKLPFLDKDGVLNNYFMVASKSQPPLFTSAVMVRHKAIQTIGGFPIGITSGEDLLTWARLASRGQIAYSIVPKVTFTIESYEVTSKPKRSNDEDDFVGRELVNLRNIYHPPYINHYISHWHKMRSSVFMRQSCRMKSVQEAVKGLWYNPFNYKLFIYIILNFLPSWLQPFKR